MDEFDFLNLMLQIMKEAGKVAMGLIHDPQASLKQDSSVITEADFQISALVKEKLKEYLNSDEHLLIDEEDPACNEYLNQEFLESKKYIWALDPVDGTRLYANRIPLYAVSLGLIKDLKPWLGMVYFPALKELFYCDGEKAYYVTNAFSNSHVCHVIAPKEQAISSHSLFFMSDTFFKDFSWRFEDCRLFISGCAAVNLCWPTIGRAIGSMDQSHIWDFAGAWPIVRAAGLNLRHCATGEVLDRLNAKDYSSSGKIWQLKDYHIVSDEKNFHELKARMSRK